MYYREMSLFDSLSGLFALGLSLLAVALILGVYLAVKITLLVIRAFIRHPKSTWLWGFFATVVISLVVIGVLVLITHGQAVMTEVQRTIAGVCLALSFFSFLGLVITALVYHLKDSDTLVRDHVNLVDEVLRSPWEWGSETPLQETEQEQLAA